MLSKKKYWYKEYTFSVFKIWNYVLTLQENDWMVTNLETKNK